MAPASTPSAQGARELEAGLLPTAHQEKQELLSRDHLSSLEGRDQDRRRKMSSCRRALLALTVLVVVMLGVTTALPPQTWNQRIPCPHHRGGGVGFHHAGAEAGAPALGAGGVAANRDEDMFACLLDAVSPEKLHEVLHRYFPTRFKDGVYETDQSAMAALHREDPPLATSLVIIAKRQATSTGNSSTTSTTSTATTPTTTITTPTTSATSPPGPGTTSTTSTSPTSTRTTTTQRTTPTTSTSRTSRPITTTFTSTASDGGLTIVTLTSFVAADPTNTADGGAQESGGSLQTNAAVPRAHNVAVEAFAGAMIGGLLML